MAMETAAVIAKQSAYGKQAKALLTQVTTAGVRVSKSVIYHSLSKAKSLNYSAEQDEHFATLTRFRTCHSLIFELRIATYSHEFFYMYINPHP
jgi:hypothetical protein